MKETETQTIYSSPAVKMMEIKTRKMLYTSNTQATLGSVEKTEGDWD